MSAETRKFYKAGEGRTVRRETDGELWPEAGDYAENTRFTRRRVDDGDLVEAEPPAQPAVVEAPAEPEAVAPPVPPAEPEAGAEPARKSRAGKTAGDGEN
ncbi:DUF2635 domain-containing protein [Bosea sp. 685]|uniref:DUF2635 domain-containing protein n=1 Tax=Bosea sp. 685 TaxID=3080057 RepID=UPI0028931096|nr:DUF2635 domain-containing protein [Bosea sp. 685]WNJ89168.1 DUF2635 domain-containing protein [Bosea sp. 685]